MPRYSSDADTVSSCFRLALPCLRRQGLFMPEGPSLSLRAGSLRCYVSYEELPETEAHYLHLCYTLNGEQYSQWVELVTVPSNLPGVTGHRYLMICPVSGRRATVLLLRDGTTQFAHRLAYGPRRLYYSSQLITPGWRWFHQIQTEDEAWERAWRKGRKLWYGGKPTRWHAHLLKLGQRAGLLYAYGVK
jgi:hypothetical protein